MGNYKKKGNKHSSEFAENEIDSNSLSLSSSDGDGTCDSTCEFEAVTDSPDKSTPLTLGRLILDHVIMLGILVLPTASVVIEGIAYHHDQTWNKVVMGEGRFPPSECAYFCQSPLGLIIPFANEEGTTLQELPLSLKCSLTRKSKSDLAFLIFNSIWVVGTIFILIVSRKSKERFYRILNIAWFYLFSASCLILAFFLARIAISGVYSSQRKGAIEILTNLEDKFSDRFANQSVDVLSIEKMHRHFSLFRNSLEICDRLESKLTIENNFEDNTEDNIRNCDNEDTVMNLGFCQLVPLKIVAAVLMVVAGVLSGIRIFLLIIDDRKIWVSSKEPMIAKLPPPEYYARQKPDKKTSYSKGEPFNI